MMASFGTTLRRALLVVPLVATLLVVAGPAPTSEAAGPGQYSPPNWLPFRQTATLGCSWANPPCTAHGYWALDIIQEINDPIYAAGAGQVIVAIADRSGNCDPTTHATQDDCPNGSSGNVVLIHHGGSSYTLYGHMRTVMASVGQWVDEGTVIGGAGDSGLTPPGFIHTHFEEWSGLLWEGGTRIQPHNLQACQDGATVSYPNVVGGNSWDDPPYGTVMRHDGACNPNGPSCTSGFIDVTGSHPFCLEVAWMVGDGITNGYVDGLFRPLNASARQAAITFLWRLAGSPAGPFPDPGFPDVSLGHPFYTAIAWGADIGLVDGYADGQFKPTRSVARQALLAWLHRLAGEPPGPFPNPGFTDVAVSHPFYTAIAWGAASNITNGYPDGSFRGGFAVNRQATSAFIYRYDQLS